MSTRGGEGGGTVHCDYGSANRSKRHIRGIFDSSATEPHGKGRVAGVVQLDKVLNCHEFRIREGTLIPVRS